MAIVKITKRTHSNLKLLKAETEETTFDKLISGLVISKMNELGMKHK